MINDVDVSNVAQRNLVQLSDFSEQTLLLSGATGFIGRWVVEILLRSGIKTPKIILVVRSKRKAIDYFQNLDHNGNLLLVEQNITQKISIKEQIDQIWHLATSSSKPTGSSAIHLAESTVLGTFRLLDLASSQVEPPKFMHTSSGAVYGRGLQPEIDITENFRLATDWLNDGEVYDSSKRAAEMILQEATKEGVVSAKNARLFAFVGPYLPLDSHFAIGNFIRSALDSKPITLTSSGVDYRSYLYAADLVSWLFTYMHSDFSEPLNIGSDQAVTIKESAELVGSIVNVDVFTNSHDAHEATKYVPNIDLARSVLGLDVYTDLTESIRRTIEWHKSQPNVK